jgi:uroporphyrinogen-III decarboxylase
MVYLARDQPDFVHELLQLIAAWNQERMEIVLDEGVHLWVRRGWYEGSDFWSPRLFHRFILPHLKREVELAHGSGVKFGYILTSGAMPLLDMILETGVDVLIGLDPVMGGADMKAMKHRSRDLMCLWGGVSGALTVERGRAEDVQEAVRTALELLGDEGGFILSPVDDVRDSSEDTWGNVQALITAWKDWAGV